MGEIKLSVIVPVFNVEKYIERCFRSLMEQTMKDGIEFIFINDCTPDKSMQICERLVSEYPERVKQVVFVNNKKNLGVSETRRKGVEIARGKYIGWCDSDDWCENNMFEEMCRAAYEKNSDIVVCNYWEIYKEERRLAIRIWHSNSPCEAIENSYKRRTFSGVLWNQLVKRDLFQKCWERIVPTNYSEDTYVLFHVYSDANSYQVVDAVLYNHRTDNEQSLVHLRENTMTAWLIQQENLKRIEQLYYINDGWKHFHVALNGFIFERKCLYKGAFSSKKDFFNTFRHSSKDIIRFYDWRKLSTWKMYIVHNCYLIMKLLKSF